MHYNTKDLTGKKYGKLTVKKMANNRLRDNRIVWKCICDCGIGIDRTGHYLKDKRVGTHSCGCAKRLNRKAAAAIPVGTKKGKLTVISEASDKITPNGDKHAMIKCVCTCGKEVKIQNAGFKKNKYLSCGRAVCKRHISDNDMVVNKKFKDYKWGAKDRNYSFNLTKKDFHNLIFNRCYYCNCEPANIYTPRVKGVGDSNNYYYNGIDRVDSTIGYELNNVVTCCGTCNIMKNTFSKKEFIEHLIKIVENLSDK